MEPLVDIVIEDARWEALGLDALADKAARGVLAELGLGAEGFMLCVMGCDDARIMELNTDFRAKAKPTNVLSWPSEERGAEDDGAAPDLPEAGDDEMPEELGDIAIAYETCAAEAAEQGKSMVDHVTHLLVHGTLHLLGFDHIREKDAALMEGCEISILAKMGLANPYD
ncbi:rRNA maturation RNase YbeY [Phaeovulum sp. W22_SRMD_FR3]|uniref:rRNA maturation RNase YbeY n=1 Tax=Phaeovulum sp. W22_SRMD_FR3 TaxID=3240274 RepID=UPI003F96E8E5